MDKLRLVIILMALAAVIIIGLAAFVFTHLSGISLNQGIVLIIVAVVGLFIVMGVIGLLVRSLNMKK